MVMDQRCETRRVGWMVRHRIANPTLRNGRVGSTPTLSAKIASMVEQVDTRDLKSLACNGHASSILATRTILRHSFNGQDMVLLKPEQWFDSTMPHQYWAGSLMVKQPTHNRSSLSSILSQPTNALVDKLVKSSLSKGEVLSVRIRARVPDMCM